MIDSRAINVQKDIWYIKVATWGVIVVGRNLNT